MTENKDSKKLEYKKLLFEYLVFLLNQWKDEIKGNNVPLLSKLRLQKILFFVSAKSATSSESVGLLREFDNFYALQYGPVEMDIYDAMNGNTSFKYIYFDGNDCMCDKLDESCFDTLKGEDKELLSSTLTTLRKEGAKYITQPVFDLVNISHQWTSWIVAMNVASLLNRNKEEMPTDSIVSSSIKVY